jgi:DNA-binding CsgD family transcriptional regulator
MTQSRYSKVKNLDSEESVFEPSHKVLLNVNQWSYLKRRYRLTNRELQVGKLVCQSYSNKEIAKILKIKPGTIKTHLLNIYRKSHVTSKITLLLKFVSATSKSSVKPVVTSAIPIVDIKKPVKKRSFLAQTHQKSK